MISYECGTKNPVTRDGTSQKMRASAALDPGYAKIDDRSLSETLEFAIKYFETLQYYNLENVPDGNWKAFIENDISTVVALISLKDSSEYQNFYNELAEIIESDSTDVDKHKSVLNLLFNLVFTISLEFNEWYENSIDGLSLHMEIKRLIPSQLKDHLSKIISYQKYAEDNLLLSTNEIDGLEAPQLLDDSEEFYSTTLNPVWLPQNTSYSDWTSYLNSLTSYAPSTDLNLNDDLSKIKNLYLLIEPIYEIFYNNLARVIQKSPAYLEETISSWNGHEPHMGLLLAFLKLFQYAQEHLNTLTKKHLDFYYKEVLQLEEKDAVTDKVHLIFELAKHITKHLVEEGTLLKAGKDDKGNDVQYETNEEVVISTAQIKEIKTVFIDKRKSTRRIYSAPVANSLDGKGTEFDEKDTPWKTFGEPQLKSDGTTYLSEENRTMEFSEIGLIIASPILFLAEGVRTITVEFYFSDITGLSKSNFENVFETKLSGEEDWIKITPTIKELNAAAKKLVMELKLNEDSPAVIKYDNELFEDTFETDYPVLKVSLINLTTQDYAYEKLKDLNITQAVITTEVTGVKNLIIQNDFGVVDSRKPFLPFGAIPAVNSSVFIGSSEVFRKKLSWCEFEIDWKDLPSDGFADLYANYFDESYAVDIDISKLKSLQGLEGLFVIAFQYLFTSSNIDDIKFSTKDKLKTFLNQLLTVDNIFQILYMAAQYGVIPPQQFFDLYQKYYANQQEKLKLQTQFNKISEEVLTSSTIVDYSSFKGQFRLLSNRKWEKLEDPKTLFNDDSGDTADSKRKIKFTGLENYDKGEIEENLTEYKHNTARGFAKLELAEPSFAFGHKLYRDVYTKKIIVYAQSPTEDNEALIPKEPYTPQINAVRINYKATETITFGSSNSVSSFVHVYPFGYNELSQAGNTSVKFLPQFTLIGEKETKENQAELYLGIEKLDPAQNLSIFFQVAEGSANPERDKEDVYWSYLSGNEWIPFEKEDIVFDTTNGLLTSGIISLNIPKEADNANSVLAKDYHWLRVSVLDNYDAICDTIAINTQAIEASFKDNNNDENFLVQALPADTISKLVVKEAEIKSISQPYSSTGGKVKEQSQQFYVRVSERLRHKDRGISIWDYERMVLEEFPQIYKVKCINHSTYDFSDDYYNIKQSEFAPGFVTVIVIPDLTNKNAVDPMEPKTPLSTLNDIKTFLSKYMSPFAARKLRVINPLYERIHVRFDVEFYSEYDPGMYTTILNEDIQKFLSPWAFGISEDIMFGGKLHKSVILNYIENRDYVDYVTNFVMDRIIEVDGKDQTEYNIDEAVPKTSRSILVSDYSHSINE